jgi:surface antigen
MQRITRSSETTSSPTSDGSLTPQSDSASTSPAALAHGQLQDLAQQIETIRLNQDVPLPSIEGSSIGSSGGVPLSRGTTHSRTPSVALTPPPAGTPENLRAAHASRRTSNSIDDRLGMSDVAAAIEGVGRDSGSPGVFLRPESPAVENSSSSRRASRRRSSSRINTAIHDVKDEELSNDRFNEATFQEAFSDAKRLMAELTAVLSSNTINHELDSTMRQLHEQASKLARFHCPSTRTVGFVGDSGVGKYCHSK